MDLIRRDSKGKILQKGESQRKDGIYQYSITLPNSKRKFIYASTLKELRDKEKELQRDIEDGIKTDTRYRNITLNQMFEYYMGIKSKIVKPNYTTDCRGSWKRYVQDTIGNTKLTELTTSQIKTLYVDMATGNLNNGLARGKSGKGLSRNSIKNCHALILGTLNLALDDELIRKNPAERAYKDFGTEPNVREALTKDEQDRLLEYMRASNVYSKRFPMVSFMIETGVRVGEAIALTWENVDFDKGCIYITGELIYKDCGEGFKLYEQTTKTSSGNRVIPLTPTAISALKEQRALNRILGYESKVTVGTRSDFIFLSNCGNPTLPSSVNFFLKNCVNAYNKEHKDKLPHISAHKLRHTCSTRLRERGVDSKVVQAIMGHKHPNITLDVYTHASEAFVFEEMQKMA